ncbi:hypothetical protein E2562_025174 [Oryza meyeriana var. granulata]|uniref:Uncharacterized protein n=1 Tax=Oryza meyeriana var. granulata TaxID=110450 RepID=A0A6G1E267_9ORYZ|nr:hypothetical protein E2562_030706 [Oryza meyeriana var. granulata]KAF0918582.1 hypothetical protein E2562_025174 [Oryza meyeriana var. granulata]
MMQEGVVADFLFAMIMMTQEIVPLRKMCRRPESDHRLQILPAARAAGAAKGTVVDSMTA